MGAVRPKIKLKKKLSQYFLKRKINLNRIRVKDGHNSFEIGVHTQKLKELTKKFNLGWEKEKEPTDEFDNGI